MEAKLNEMNTVGDIKSVTMAEVSLNACDSFACNYGCQIKTLMKVHLMQEAAKYPEIVAEIEEEISNHEWFK